MPVMTSLVCVMSGRRAAVGCAVMHPLIVRVLMLHKISFGPLQEQDAQEVQILADPSYFTEGNPGKTWNRP
jgi:hypothetical protein